MEAAVRWSPHSTGGRQRFLVVDVADQSLTLNVADNITKNAIDYRAVARYGRLPHFGAFAWSPADESIVALGLVSGNASLIRLREGKEPSETVTTFRIKQQRKCNSVAFSSQRWLAVALDKTRSDVCLNIYDTNADSIASQDPIRRLCPAELVSSVRFFSSQPQEIIVAAQRSFMRLYDLRDGYFTSGASAQVATRNGNNIAIDPMDEHYFASAGSTDDPTVAVWDKRWLTSHNASSSGGNGGAVFNFSPSVDNSVKTSVWSLRYSGQHRGRLAICSSTGELRVIDMIEGPTAIERSGENAPHNPYGGTPWISNRYVSQTRSLERPFHDERHGRDHSARIVAFDWMSGDGQAAEQGLVTLRPNRDLDVHRVSAAAFQSHVTARQDLCIDSRELSLTEARDRHHAEVSVSTHLPQPASAEDFGPREYNGEDVQANGYEGDGTRCQRDSSRLTELLASANTQRERCRNGYLFDCAQNSQIVSGHWSLERLWEIVNRFQEQADEDGMVHNTYDLSYIGVSGMWSETIGNSSKRKMSLAAAKVSDAILGLNSQKEFRPFDGERTEFPEHRQLCLLICGWKFTIETLEEECQELIERGLYYQAIVQAVLHEQKHIALNLLRTLIRSKTIPNIGLNALLACDEINAEQREMCMWMAADTQDPALKALLTFLTTGNWRDVMKTNYLHLGYRVALGLKYLNDTELSGFLQTETARAIKNGDLEGTLLTGLGEQAMDLFQTYIVKTNDLQTAVLATAHTNPLYVDDTRWEMWKETYFAQMQSWKLFAERSNFVVQHSQMSRSREGLALLPQPQSQVSLKCTHCQRSLERRQPSNLPAGVSNGVRVSSPEANAGTICPRCGRHMPRCGICMLWLGTPDSSRTGGARQLQKLGDMMGKFLSFCADCGHGFHTDHARSWFKKHGMCPVSSCHCLCRLEQT